VRSVKSVVFHYRCSQKDRPGSPDCRGQWIFTDFTDWTDLEERSECRGGGTVVGRVVLAWELKNSS
jgi:hypothetical protein